MATTPAAPTNALIAALRGASAPGLANPGIKFYGNAQNGMAASPFVRKTFAPYTPPTAMVPPAPRPTIPAVDIPSNDGARVTPVDPVPFTPTIRPREPEVIVESLDDIEEPYVDVGEDLVVDTTPLPNVIVPEPLPKIETNDKPLKQDASHWGEGGEDLVADDAAPIAAADDVNGADLDSDKYTFGVLQSDADKPLKQDASEWGAGAEDLVADDTVTATSPADVNGADLQSDQYTFGVLQSDQDPPLKKDASDWGAGGDLLVANEPLDLGGADDVNGADLQSDQYTFGVLQSDQDPALKQDASHWGDGAEDLSAPDVDLDLDVVDDVNGSDLQSDQYTFGVLQSDADSEPAPVIEESIKPDVNGADLQSDQYTFGVLDSDIDAADLLGSVNDVNGADLQSDQYSFGVLMDDVDDPGSSDDVNGSDLASDQYTLGVLMSDQDPVREEIIDVNQLIDELNLLAFAKEAEKKLEEKFGDTEFAYQ